ncbi:MAG TPA: MlaD family protein [Gemmatimonas sp.]|nr:MlaD family protein [Gemmatimonas sp.]
MKRRDEVLVGSLLLVAVTIALGGTIWLARGGLKSGYAMYSRFPWGAGLKQGQPVLLAGVNVGFVDRVELIPDGTLGVTYKVQSQYRIPVGTTATVQANGIFGDQQIALTPVRASTQSLPEGDTIPVGIAAPGIPQLLSKGDSVAANALAISAGLRSTFVDSGGINEIRATVKDMSRLLTQVSAVTAEQSRQLTLTQTSLRRTLASVDSTKVDSTVTNLRAASANLEQLSREVKATNTQVQGVLDKVSTGNGTAGRLLNDPAIYEQLQVTMRRVDSLLIDIKANPRKYINLRIF